METEDQISAIHEFTIESELYKHIKKCDITSFQR